MNSLGILVTITKLRYYIDELETEVKKESPDIEHIRSLYGTIYEENRKIPTFVDSEMTLR